MIYLIEGNEKLLAGDVEGATLCIDAASILAASRARRNPSEARHIINLDSTLSSRYKIAEETNDLLKFVISLREHLNILQELQTDETACDEITESAQQTRSQLTTFAGDIYVSGIKQIEDGEVNEGISLILFSRDIVSAVWEGAEGDAVTGVLYAQCEWILGKMLTASDFSVARKHYDNALMVLDKVVEFNPEDSKSTALRDQIVGDLSESRIVEDDEEDVIGG